MDYEQRRKESAMDEQNHERESSRPGKKATKGSRKVQRIEPAELVAAIDSCLVRYRLALQKAELTISFCRDYRPIEGVIETVKAEKDWLEKQQRELEKARVPWSTDQFKMARAILDLDEGIISALPQEVREILLSFRQDTGHFDVELQHGLAVVERNNAMLRQVTNVLWGFRWEDEERAKSLLESLQKAQTEPSRPADTVHLEELSMRKG
jgi:hypothetical protein